MKLKVLCIGEILWDCFSQGSFLGGAPFNVSCHLHMLGVEVVMVSRIGKDILGDQVVRRMIQLGMSTQYLQFDEHHATGIVNVTIDSSGHPSYEIVEPAAWDFIEINDQLINIARNSKAIIFGSLCQRNLISRKTIQIIRNLNPCNIFDINLRPPFVEKEIIKSSLFDAYIVKLNEDELQQLSKWFHLSKETREAIRELATKFDCPTICVTRGSDGSLLWHKGVWMDHDGFQVKIKDTVGAGDAFLAAFLFKLFSGYDNFEIVDFANAVGAYVTTHHGATPVLDLEQIEILRKKRRGSGGG